MVLESIMRVYDEDGKVLKSRVPEEGGPASTDDSGDENAPLKLWLIIVLEVKN